MATSKSRLLLLTNTLGGKKSVFESEKEGEVSIYTCGPTVYGDQHIGNYRTFIFEDVLVKTLRYFGYSVKRVMNITDVGHLTSDADEGEDKLQLGARREGKTAWEVAKHYEERFISDLALLHIERPEPLVRATDTINSQIELVKQLESKGYTYITSDGVYFNSAKIEDYGKLAQLDIEGLRAGVRVDIGEKRSITDFALWKFSPSGMSRDMEWDSPWGKGFPGWHLECSAIIKQTLGESIDIHCGGVDHIPVHHTNEIAQSETLTGRPLARYWLHADFLTIDGGKMAKSLGNLYTVSDLQQANIEPLAFRLLCYSAHYRSKLNFTWEALESAQRSLLRLRRLYAAADRGVSTDTQDHIGRFEAALSDDCNTAEALAVLYAVATGPYTRAVRQQVMDTFDQIFSLNLQAQSPAVTVTAEAEDLLHQRQIAREQKEWALADQLRLKLEDLGYTVSDTPSGTNLS